MAASTTHGAPRCSHHAAKAALGERLIMNRGIGLRVTELCLSRGRTLNTTKGIPLIISCAEDEIPRRLLCPMAVMRGSRQCLGATLGATAETQLIVTILYQ